MRALGLFIVGLILATQLVVPVDVEAVPDDCPPHPYPCRDDWPANLKGPFRLKEVQHLKVRSFDGVELDGWIAFPDVPKRVRVPVALSSSPYPGFCSVRPESYVGGRTSLCSSSPNDPAWWTSSPPGGALESWGVPPLDLVRRGIAVALFSVRGTGNSGGCFEFTGPSEQKDQVRLVRWLARQPWSSGRVAMGGLSYQGGTPWGAAIGNPGALKTIVVTGVVTDLYTWFHTPQGALWDSYAGLTATYNTSVSLMPPLGQGVQQGTIDHLPYVPPRACTEFASGVAAPLLGTAIDSRDKTYWDERRVIDRFDDVTAAVLLAQGFDDVFGHTTQESAVWRALKKAPKRQIEGHWGHTFPMPQVARLHPGWAQNTWSEVVLSWLDYWLKGIGPAPARLNGVDYQDSKGVWRRSGSWPPAEAREEVLYLTGTELRGRTGTGTRTFRSIPPTTNEFGTAEAVGVPFNTWPALCIDPSVPVPGRGLTYLTKPLARDATFAGNPFAYLRISSDLPGGIVAVHLVEIPRDFDCSSIGEPASAKVVALGAADLRFHRGNFKGVDFPVGDPTNVRVDLWDNAEVIEAGSRLGLIISHGEALAVHSRLGLPLYPEITLHADGGARASHVVLPLVDGTLGGAKARLTYPARPFVPR